MPPSSLGELFSGAVRAIDRWGDDIAEDLLWPEEAALLGPVVEGRRRDFVNGRWCARRAMTDLGADPAPVLRVADHRAPLWPAGLVGSITHTDAYAAAVVGRTDSVRSIGIDAEPDAPLPPRVLRRIAFEAERRWAEANTAGMGVEHADRLLFSAKESVYKAWHPIAGTWLGFGEARLEFDAFGHFEASILVEGPVQRMVGRYAAFGDIIVTAVELSRGVR